MFVRSQRGGARLGLPLLKIFSQHLNQGQTIVSRGQGAVQRAVIAALENAAGPLTLEELCLVVYPGIARARRTHKSSIGRALNSIDGAFWVRGKFGHNRRFWGLRKPKAKLRKGEPRR
jgi:hypothetical protein